MSALTIVFTVLQVLSGLAVTAIVLMQSGKSAGLSGAISGGAETFLSKGNAGCKACKDDQVVRTCLRYPHSDPEPYLSGQSANEKQRRNFPPLFFVQS